MSREPICREIASCHGRDDTQAFQKWANQFSSLSESRKCGCDHCHIACKAVDLRDETETKTKPQDRLAAVFRTSGLQFFDPTPLQTEFFVQDGKISH